MTRLPEPGLPSHAPVRTPGDIRPLTAKGAGGMLSPILHAWHARARKARLAALARRLGPHIARDIGIDEGACAQFYPTIKPI